MVASHNEDTVRFTLQQMQKNNIKPEDKVGKQPCLLNTDGICPNRWSALDNFWACATTSPSHWVRPIYFKDFIVSPPPFRPGGLQRVQVRSVRSRQRGAPIPFQVPQIVKGFCLMNHIFPRRAHENKGILEKLEKEKSLLKRELRDRVGILLNVKETMVIRSKQQKDDQQGLWKI